MCSVGKEEETKHLAVWSRRLYVCYYKFSSPHTSRGLRFSVRCSRGFPPLGCDVALPFEGTYLLHHKGFSSSWTIRNSTLGDECLPDIWKDLGIETAAHPRRLDYSILDFHYQDKYFDGVQFVVLVKFVWNINRPSKNWEFSAWQACRKLIGFWCKELTLACLKNILKMEILMTVLCAWFYHLR